MKQSLGEFLATLRRANGYTQQEVADKLGVSNRTLSAWARGASMPDYCSCLLWPICTASPSTKFCAASALNRPKLRLLKNPGKTSISASLPHSQRLPT